MADTTFIAQSFDTPIRASWLNEVNGLVHKAFGNSGSSITAQQIGLTATGIVGIGNASVATTATAWAASDANYSGIVMNNLAILAYSNTNWELYHNIDRNFNRVVADGSTWIYNKGEDFSLYSYPAGAAGGAVSGPTFLRLLPQVMVLGFGTQRVPPANEYQVSVFGNAWLHGTTSETAGQVLTLSQGSYKSAAGNFIHAFNSEEASQVVLRDGTVVLKCAAAGAGGATVTFVDSLSASPTGVSVVGNLAVTGNITSTSAPLALTPTLAFGGASVGITYAAGGQVGYQWVNGKVCHFQIRISLTSKGSSVGNATIGGLTVNSLNQTNAHYTFATEAALVDTNSAGGYYHVTCSLAENSTTIIIRESGDNVALLPLSDVRFSNTSIMIISGSYLTN